MQGVAAAAENSGGMGGGRSMRVASLAMPPASHSHSPDGLPLTGGALLHEAASGLVAGGGGYTPSALRPSTSCCGAHPRDGPGFWSMAKQNFTSKECIITSSVGA